MRITNLSGDQSPDINRFRQARHFSLAGYARKSKTGLALVAVSIAALCLTACSTTTARSTNTGALGRSKILITVPTWWAPAQEMPPTQAYYDSAFKNTNIAVKLKYVVQNSYNEKVITQAATGSPYPVLSVGEGNLPSLIAGHIIQPLNSFMKKSHFSTNGYIPGALQALTIGGKQYGLTNDQGGFYLYYNETLFKKAHLALPQPGMTWNTMLQDAKILTTPNHSIWGLDFTDVTFAIDLWARMNGAYLFNPSLTKINLTSTPVSTGLTFAHNLIYKYHVAPPVSSSAVTALSLFQDGDVGMMIGGSWDIDSLRYTGAKDPWNITSLPVGPDATSGVINPLFDGVYAMSAGISPKLAAASWRVIETYASLRFADTIMGRHLSSLPALWKEAYTPSAYDLWPKKEPENLTEGFVTTYLKHEVHMREQELNMTTNLTSALNLLGDLFSTSENPQKLMSSLEQPINTDLVAALPYDLGR